MFVNLRQNYPELRLNCLCFSDLMTGTTTSTDTWSTSVGRRTRSCAPSVVASSRTSRTVSTTWRGSTRLSARLWRRMSAPDWSSSLGAPRVSRAPLCLLPQLDSLHTLLRRAPWPRLLLIVKCWKIIYFCVKLLKQWYEALGSVSVWIYLNILLFHMRERKYQCNNFCDNMKYYCWKKI